MSGQIPVFLNLELMFLIVKLCCHAGQDNRFVIEIRPRFLNIRSLSPLVYWVARGLNSETSRGCNQCVECGGKIINTIRSRSHSLINAILTWLE